jgi:hypothetical protein
MSNRKLLSLAVVLTLAILNFGGRVKADDNVPEEILPAGTLIRCTLDEPNFSTKTADVGDPVVCNLSQLILFNRPVFPRGAYLSGHLESEKEPGHMLGKGYLQIQFDKIGFPEGQIPVPAKLIGARGYRVDRQGKIIGHGHAVRDAAEWMIPPLWPEKIVMLPARGPRPALKGEQELVLRIMDDVAVPMFGWRYFTQPPSSSFNQPSSSRNKYVPRSTPAQAPQPNGGVAMAAGKGAVPSNTVSGAYERTAFVKTQIPPSAAANVWANILVLRDGSSCVGKDLRLGGGQVNYARADGTVEALPLDEVDWPKTVEKNAENGVPLILSSTTH